MSRRLNITVLVDPVTIPSDDPHFQKPIYQVMVQSMEGAKAWPLISEWPECTELIWNAVSLTLLGETDAQTALDEAAAEIDALRGM